MKKFIAAFLFLSAPAWSQTPTVVYGASETAPDKPDAYMVIQPKNSPNPLGNPIVGTSSPNQDNAPTLPASETIPVTTQSLPDIGGQDTIIHQSAEQNPPPFSQSPQEQQNQIENTLYQGGDRIYDVQSFPVQDMKTITEPNIQPTITTYPEY